MNMIKYFSIFFIALLSFKTANAQDQIRVYDWSVVITPIPVKSLEKQDDKSEVKQEEEVERHQPPTEAEVKVLFKVDDLSKADKVYITVGNKPGSDNYKSEVLKVEKVKEGYQLKDDKNNVFKVWGKSVYYTFHIPIKDSDKVKHATVYLKTTSGNSTDKHSLKIN